MKLFDTLITFCRRNRLQAILFVCSFYMLIRLSDIPYPIKPCPIVKLAFSHSTDPFATATGDLVETLASAYVTSLIFHYFADAAPKIKKEAASLSGLNPPINQLIGYANELISIVRYLAPANMRDSPDKIDAHLNEIAFKDKEVYCKTSNRTLLERSGFGIKRINPYADCETLHRGIRETVSGMIASPLFPDAPWELTRAISGISQSDFLNAMQFIFSSGHPPSIGVRFVFGSQSYSNFLVAVNELQIFSNSKIERDVLSDASELEIATFQQHQDEHMSAFLAAHPEAVDVIVAAPKENNRTKDGQQHG